MRPVSARARIVLSARPTRPGKRAQSLARRGGQRRQPAIRRIDDDRVRASPLTMVNVDPGSSQNVVVAAHVSGGAADPSPPFGGAARSALLGSAPRSSAAATAPSSFAPLPRARRRIHARRPLERRERREVVGALKVRLSVGQARG